MGFGIDFGTTCSSGVGILKNNAGNLQIIKASAEGGIPIPSLVAINKHTGEVICGKAVKDQYNEFNETCYVIRSIKSILNDEHFCITVAGVTWNAVDIAAEIFHTISETMYEKYHVNMDEAVVSIPVGFDNIKRQKLRMAAEKAGIRIKDFIGEPTAAYLANREKLKSANKVLVFDWGGGTLDVTILSNEDGKITEIATEGLSKAGDFIDDMLARRIHNLMAKSKNRMDVAFEDIPLNKQDAIKVMAEKAKCEFSDNDSSDIFLVNYGELGNITMTLDYDWFKDIIAGLVDEAMDCVNTTLRYAKMGTASIDAVIMVGGSSQLRPIREAMQKRFGDKLIIPQDSSWNVGEGAAKIASMEGEHFAAQDINIILSDGTPYPILQKGEALKGWHNTITLGIVDTTNEARLVFSGSMDIDESNKKYYIVKVPAYRFRREAIWITASIDENLIFKVEAGSRNMPGYYKAEWIYENLKTGFAVD